MSDTEELLLQIHSPEDVKALKPEQLNTLCQEIRKQLIETISRNGGHLASNLGVVELTVALHRTFDVPGDQIVWDVGHQAYTHKLLTGRREQFDTLRKKYGLSGFPKRKESECDAFIAGHSSTSISAAFGLARANSLNGNKNFVVAVVGDGAMTGGMIYEGLNNAGRYRDRLIIILNDNKVSISKNVGAIARYLAQIRTKPSYFRAKDRIERFVLKIPVFGKRIHHAILRSKSMLKYVLYHSTMFEDFGFVYLGPVDGHDIKRLCEVMERAKALNKPVVIHVETTKGKGYPFAEENPGAYHGISKFNIETGNSDISPEDSFSTVFGKELMRLGQEDSRICAITAAMKYGTGLQFFAAEHRKRFLDVGIAEQHAVTCAAGMAHNGMLPVFAVYSTFLQRGYDQVLHDAAIEPAHIVLAIDRAGIVGDDGETHQGLFDVAFLSSIPGVSIYSPSSYEELKRSLYLALYQQTGVAAVRYPRGSEMQVSQRFQLTGDKYALYTRQSNRLIITYGRVYASVCGAVEQIEQQGGSCDILKLILLTSLDEEFYKQICNYQQIYFVEEGIKNGSIAEHVAAGLLERGFTGEYHIRAIDNAFVPQQTVLQAFAEFGLDVQGVYSFVQGGQK